MNLHSKKTEDLDQPEMDQICAMCGKEEKDWRGHGGRGYQENEEVYCCEGCAMGTGCTCHAIAESEESETVETPSKSRGRHAA